MAEEKVIFSRRDTNDLQAKGVEEAKKEEIKREVIQEDTISKLTKTSNRVIASASTVFPFTPFPSTIYLEDTRIIIIFRKFFSTAQVHNIDIKNITNIFVEIAPVFASIVIVSRTFKENEISIKRLWKKQAIEMRNMIEGLRLMTEQQLDTSRYTTDELRKRLKQLSSDAMVLKEI